MARPRLSSGLAIAQVSLHGLGAVLCLAAFFAAAYTASLGYGYGTAVTGTFIAVYP